MNSHYTYFLILALTLAGPLLLSFDKKVTFYKKWKYVFPAMLLPAVAYIIWDSLFTSLEIWKFNDQYITGAILLNLPIEEVLFFFVIPYCCVFIYECIRVYFPGIKNNRTSSLILLLIAALLFVMGIIFYNKAYTASTFLLTAIFIGLILSLPGYFKHFNSTAFLLSYAIILVPFLIVNGFLATLPAVIYNDHENLGIKIHTIPVEDIFYGMLLVMMNIVGYERIKN